MLAMLLLKAGPLKRGRGEVMRLSHLKWQRGGDEAVALRHGRGEVMRLSHLDMVEGR
jgi:hypothetical protein